MIPKKIHYCWFGRNDKPKLAEKCIASWKKYCPDYEIIEWNEDNFDVYQNEYTKFCYENRKWAFLSDYARLQIVYDNGGIYFDTDVEVIKIFDDLLEFEAFYGFENDNYIASGLGFGAEKEHPSLKLMIDEYLSFKKDKNGVMEMIGCPTLNTYALKKFGTQINGKCQEVKNVKILSAEYLNPYDDATGRLNSTDNTYSIHWFAKSALDTKAKIRAKLTRPLHRIFGVDAFARFRK